VARGTQDAGGGMSELTPVGHLMVSAQAADLPLHASAAELRARHEAVQEEFKRHRDAETMGLQMAWLGLIAIERVRQMEESHAGAGGDRGHGGRGNRGGPADRLRGPGGGWSHVSASGEPSPEASVRPH
jgi:hypothetical protein